MKGELTRSSSSAGVAENPGIIQAFGFAFVQYDIIVIVIVIPICCLGFFLQKRICITRNSTEFKSPGWIWWLCIEKKYLPGSWQGEQIWYWDAMCMDGQWLLRFAGTTSSSVASMKFSKHLNTHCVPDFERSVSLYKSLLASSSWTDLPPVPSAVPLLTNLPKLLTPQ